MKRWSASLVAVVALTSMFLVAACDESVDGKVTDTEIAIWIYNTTKSDTYFLWAATSTTPHPAPPGSVPPGTRPLRACA